MSKAPKTPDLSRARKAFKKFTGHDAVRGYHAPLDAGAVTGYRMGQVVGIAYEARRDGQTDQYFHRFRKSSRPDLVAKDDGSQLFITGGKYRVTERGIEDTMASRLFVVNPSPRRRKKRRAAGRRRRVSIFTTNPVRRRRRRRATTYRRNPVALANPVRRRRRVARYRRNPISLGGGRGGIKITSLIMPAVTVGAGAVAVEIGMGFLPLPARLKTGMARHATKGALSLALGWAVARFSSKRLGEALALGGLTIATHDAIKEQILRMAPGVRFGQYENRMGEYMGEYLGGSGSFDDPSLVDGSAGFGYTSAGEILDAQYVGSSNGGF